MSRTIASRSESPSEAPESGLHPRLIILDLTMAGMDGFQCRERQMSDPRFREMPITILTAARDPQDIERAFGAPGLWKPYLLNDVLDAVRRQIGEPR